MPIRKWREICVVLFCLMLLVGCGMQTTYAASSDTIPVSMNTRLHYFKGVDPHFVSFSVEISDICDILRLDAQSPAHYEQLFHNLGEGILRIGAHSADFSTWSPDGKLSC